MTDQQLQQLAREYAEQNIPKGLKDDSLVKSIVYNNTEMFADFLRWLSARYCIVEKSEITEWINTLEIYMPTKHTKTMLKIGAKSLFGKELFTDTKQ